ncbi:MAG: hypothetical protein OXF27_10325 [Acidobacteria bacterium]|nr:hypothetical protein [Acidobacteriota bacterium]
MNFTVEVLLKGREDVVARSLEHPVAPGDWTDADVRELLYMALREFEQAQSPDADEPRPVQLRGFSWIVTPLKTGVAIAIEIATGALVAGPFEVDADWLTAAINRVLAAPASVQPDGVH